MKVSVSLPGEDVEFLDSYAREQGLESRSAALHKAVRLLRAAELGTAYEGAWDEWAAGGDAGQWDRAAGDGVVADAARLHLRRRSRPVNGFRVEQAAPGGDREQRC